MNKKILFLICSLYLTTQLYTYNQTIKYFIGTAYTAITSAVTIKTIQYYKQKKVVPSNKQQKTLDSLFAKQMQTQCFKPKDITKKFSDIGGYSYAKETLQFVNNCLSNEQPFEIQLPSCILITGPSGIGKTTLAQAYAKESNNLLVQTTAQNITDLLKTTKMNTLINDLREFGPCILLINSINELNQKVISDLIDEINATQNRSKPILLIGTSIENISIPKADYTVHLNYPNIAERLEILQILLNKKECKSDLDIDYIAKLCRGMTGLTIEKMINQACLIALKNNQKFITTQDIYQARATIMLGEEGKNVTLSNEKIKVTAYHEAGHALMTILQQEQPYYFDMVSILPRLKSFGISLGASIRMSSEEANQKYSKKEFLESINICLAGAAAEELIFNITSSAGTQSDFKNATNYAHDMICNFGMTNILGKQIMTKPVDHYSQKTLEKIDEAITTILDEQYLITYNLLKENIDKLELLAQELLKKETLYAHEVYELLGIK